MVHNDNGICFFCREQKFAWVGSASFLGFLSFFVKKSLQEFRRKFFRTPLFPLEVFAENEKPPVIWRNYQEEVQKRSIF